MSWSDRLYELRNGSLHFAAAAEGQLGKLLRKVSARPDPPPPARSQRFEPRRTADPEFHAPPARPPSSYSRSTFGESPGSPTTKRPDTRSCEMPPRNKHPAPSAPINLVSSFNPGERIGNGLEVQTVLSRTGLFDTYLTRHLSWKIDLVVKVPRPHLLTREGGLQAMFDAAAQWTGLGLHAHVLYCYGLHVFDGIPALLLEHASGGDLRTRLDRGSTTDLRRGLNLGIQLCHALEHVHDEGLWHGAVTPENLLFAADGSLLLGVPDIASHCQPHRFPADGDLAAPGSQRYLPPERRRDRCTLDARADIFSLGVCLYETLCGEIPDGPEHDTRMEPPEPILRGGEAAPQRLTELLSGCLAGDAAQRPASVADIRHELCAVYEEQFQRPSPYTQLRSVAWRADGWNNQALVACWLGKNDEADEAWSKALDATPDHVESTFNRALMRWRWGTISDENALGEIERLSEPHAGHERIAHLLGLFHLERGDPSSALLFLERAARSATDDSEVMTTLRRARSEAETGDGGSELHGHEDFVSAVTLHPENRWILSAGDDCRLILWDARESRPIRTFNGHLGRLSSVCLNDDGWIAVSGSDDATLRLWDAKTGTCLKSLNTVGAVFSVALSGDGRRAVSSSSGTNNFLGVDNTVLQVWDVDKGRCLGELVGHTSAAKALALTTDGQTAFSAGDDHTVRIWDLSRLACYRVLEGHRHYVTSVAVTPDGKKVISGSWDQSLRLWDPLSGQCVRIYTGARTIVTCVAISADGRTAVSGCWDGSVLAWDVETGRCLRTFTGHSRMVTGVAVSADGRTVVSGSWDGTVRVWNLPGEQATACSPLLSQRH